ncbi:dual specificity protein phosphatase 26-like [Stegastes partitus]|uniref:Dual specificity protein phosphatase n=1 Tax=Stegastes partitus TaxID=144197 RepID=A0A3B5B280_9TELE|nr:PREDICTED: dual specificity protein phosphatase 26-like [Stegastes partitus]XP_008293926.1 PREDICTED: dual specificity protein phosphatase 26-like [Stegastes partitus]XP_008293927.1 PREDICTED: dual specificity protein phosphatase 26-like [Stegastes partitus]
MSYTSKLPASWNDERPPRKVEIDLSSPGLAVFELERLLFTGKAIISHANEVWPRLYIGDQDSAENRADLSMHRITHILNAAHSKRRGRPEIYEGMRITYMGIEAHDSCGFDMSVNFQAAADFIQSALSRGGKVLVHCHVGVSRSATLVLAYLMLKQNLTLVEAICAVKDNRGVIPNRGFLRQLIKLDGQLFGKHH